MKSIKKIKHKNIITAYIVFTLMQFIFIASGYLALEFSFDFGIPSGLFDRTDLIVAFSLGTLFCAFSFIEYEQRGRFLLFGSSMFAVLLFSYFSFNSSLLINKFIFVTNILRLRENYALFFEGEILDFLHNTLPLHQGDSESAGVSFFYLVPLFLSLFKFGGLSLFNLALVNAFISLFAVFIFFFFVRKYYGNAAATSASLLFSVSYFFQNFIRSSSYMGISLLICVLLLFFFYAALEKKGNIKIAAIFLALGFMFYGPLRYMFFLPLVFLKERGKRKKTLIFYLWFFLFISPFALLRFFKGGAFFDEENIFVYVSGYEYGENIFEYIVKMGANFNPIDFVQAALKQLKNNFALIRSLFNISNLGVNAQHSPLMSGILVPFFLVGFLTILKNRRKLRYFVLLLLFFAVIVLPFFLTADPIQTRRLILWPPVIFLFIGIGVNSVVKFFDNIFLKKLTLLLCVSVLFLYAIQEGRRAVYYLPKRAPLLEFSGLKDVLRDDYDTHKDMRRLIDDYFMAGIDREKIERMGFDMTSLGDSMEAASIAEVARVYPEEIFLGSNEEFFGENFLSHWGVYGDAFSAQPVYKKDVSSHLDISVIDDEKIIDTFYRADGENTVLVGDDPIGTLTSPAFTVTHKYLNFRLSGGYSLNERVELLVDDKVVLWKHLVFGEEHQSVKWDMTPYLGKKARICLVDYSGKPGGYLVVYGFAFSD